MSQTESPTLFFCVDNGSINILTVGVYCNLYIIFISYRQVDTMIDFVSIISDEGRIKTFVNMIRVTYSLPLSNVEVFRDEGIKNG